MQRRAAEESLTDHGKDNSNGRAHVGDAIRHKPGILGFLRQIGFMGATGIPLTRVRLRPPLIKGYVRAGCLVGDGAVIDYQFHTIDVCVVLRTDRVNERFRQRYEGGIGEPAVR